MTLMSYKDDDRFHFEIFLITTTLLHSNLTEIEEGVKLSEIKYVDNLSLYDETILRGVGKL